MDTGADDTVFPDSVAATLGVDLANAPQASCFGVGGTVSVVRLAEVSLWIADRQERREWKAWVGFSPVPLRIALQGFAGFLEFFTATFLGDQDAVELTVNTLYPGT